MRAWIAFLFLSIGALAQCPPDTCPTDHKASSDAPTVRFIFDFADVEPHHYVIKVDPSGAGTYIADYKANGDKSDPDMVDQMEKTIRLQPETTRKIFDTAKAQHYFAGDYEYTKQRIAFTGKKTLVYVDATHNSCTTLNYTENKDLMALVELFQGIGSTLELGHRLEHLYKHQRLGLYQELKTAEEMSKSGWLKETGLIKDVLEKIQNDTKVMNLARQSAARLLTATR